MFAGYHSLIPSRQIAITALAALSLGACSPSIDAHSQTKPLLGPPVNDNVTPYTVCLEELAKNPGRNRPTIAVGNILDKTGKRAYDLINDSTEVTQGASEMVISAFYKTRQVNLAERLDPRIALAEQQLVQTDLIKQPVGDANVAPAHFVILGAVTELNYNIHSGGEQLFVAGVGASRRAAVINVHNAGMKRYHETGEKRVVGAGLLQLEAKRKDGTVFPVEATIASVDADGEEIFVSYLRDVSTRVAAEKELVEARDRAVAGEKAKAELWAVMSHEMRTPLNGLLGTMELMQDTRLVPEQRKYLSAMEISARLLLHHVNDVLSISRAEAGQLDLRPTVIDPNEFLSELVESQQSSISANGNTVTFSTEQAPARIWADRTRLHQVILNLLGNANKFTRNGQIVLECDSVADGRVVEFRVIDNGIGISEEDQPLIWEDFRTLDASYGRVTEGSGLGLAISKRLVAAIGGENGVESEPGEGSLFWVRLPVGAPVETASVTNREKKPRVSTRTSAGPLHILLVEDNKINRLVARDMLEKAGHRVVEAGDGREAIDAAAKEPFDIILMDISMPEIDGVTATNTIRDAKNPNRKTPIIALTAHALDEDLVRFREAGVTDTIVKPLTRKDLLRAVDEIGHFTGPCDRAAMEDVFSVLRARMGAAEAIALIHGFIAATDRLAVRCSDAVGSLEDAHELAEQAHNAAGTAAVFRFEALGRSLNNLETELTKDVRRNLPALVATFNRTWSQAREDLNLHLQRLSGEYSEHSCIARDVEPL